MAKTQKIYLIQVDGDVLTLHATIEKCHHSSSIWKTASRKSRDLVGHSHKTIELVAPLFKKYSKFILTMLLGIHVHIL